MTIKEIVAGPGSLPYNPLCSTLIDRFSVKQSVKWEEAARGQGFLYAFGVVGHNPLKASFGNPQQFRHDQIYIRIYTIILKNI